MEWAVGIVDETRVVEEATEEKDEKEISSDKGGTIPPMEDTGN